ncbi:MAG: phosphotransferase [Bowdeniella nasicola]|nr:phosphotransferase [Bowdeniella nasicola]
MHTLHSYALAAAATAAIPDCDVVAVGPLVDRSPDWAHTTVMDTTGRRYTVTAALHEGTGSKLAAEQPILDALAKLRDQGRVPWQVAKTLGAARTREGYAVVAHRELPGRVVPVETITVPAAMAMAEAVASIHELPRTVVEDLDLPVETAEEMRGRHLAQIDEAAQSSRVPTSLLNRWENLLENVSLWHFAPCVIHGDLSSENLLFSNETGVASITGWSGLRVGDPAEDLAWFFATAPEETLAPFEDAYHKHRAITPDEHLVDRALLLSELALAQWLLHGIHTDSSEVVADAEEMLANLARQVGDDRPLSVSAPDITTSGEQEPAGFVAGDWPDTSDMPDVRDLPATPDMPDSDFPEGTH